MPTDSNRVVIIGPPKSGKTTLAVEMATALGVPVRHTDDLIGKLEWSAASEHISTVWFADRGPWIIEGVAVVRALRKWLASNPSGKPCDAVIEITQARLALTPRQAGMAKAYLGIWTDIQREVRGRGVVVEAK